MASNAKSMLSLWSSFSTVLGVLFTSIVPHLASTWPSSIPACGPSDPRDQPRAGTRVLRLSGSRHASGIPAVANATSRGTLQDPLSSTSCVGGGTAAKLEKLEEYVGRYTGELATWATTKRRCEARAAYVPFFAKAGNAAGKVKVYPYDDSFRLTLTLTLTLTLNLTLIGCTRRRFV